MKKTIAILISLVVFCSITPPMITAEDDDDNNSCIYPMFGGDEEHSGVAQDHCIEDVSLLKKKWESKIPESDFIGIESLVTAKGKIYTITEDLDFKKTMMHCLRSTDGKIIWSRQLDLPMLFSQMAISGEKIFYGDAMGMKCLSTKSGMPLWSYDVDISEVMQTIIYSPKPTIYDDKIYTTFGLGKIACFSMSGGKLWLDKITSSSNYYSYSSPIISNNKLFVLMDNLYCLSPSNGRQIWSSFVGNGGTGLANISSYKDKIIASIDQRSSNTNYFANDDEDKPTPNTIVCVEQEKGKVLWKFKTQDDVFSGFAVDQDSNSVFFGCVDSKMYGLDIETGKEKWNLTLPEKIIGSPTIFGKYILIGCYDDNLYCINKLSGKIAAKYETNGAVPTPPAVLDNMVIVSTTDNNIICFEGKSGPKPTSIDISPKNPTAFVNEKIQFEATVLDQDGKKIIGLQPVWKVDPPKYGTIDQFGVFLPAEKGNCTITASIGKLSASTNVEVYMKQPLEFTEILDFGEVEQDTTRTIEFVIKNPEPYEAKFKITTKSKWVTFDPSSGKIDPENTITIKATANPESLEMDQLVTEKAELEYNYGEGEITIQAQKTYNPPPLLAPKEIELAGVKQGENIKKSFQIINQAKKEYKISCKSTTPWLKVPVEEIIIPADNEATFEFEISTNGLALSKTHTGIVIVKWPKGELELPVKVEMVKDVTSPKITIDKIGDLVNQDSYVIMGSANETVTAKAIFGGIEINGKQNAPNTFTITVPLKPAPSKNIFKIEVTDESGNKTMADVIIINIAEKRVELTVGSQTMMVDGVEVQINPPPYIKGGTTMVPLRAIADAFGAEVNYDGKTKSISIKYGQIKITMVVNKTEAIVNGKRVKISPPPETHKSGRVTVPFRFIAEAFGAEVTYDATTKSIILTKQIRP
ncbi:MAG TPA: stalk domain-containing protein [Caldisericia bacterium]|nr:PQQ-binding-like beta-propeller repeat protein [Caldisericia bacterium]HOR46192.1 stalk domain-containing protein [Caldisericia bacterium]HOU07920.1 stalk domain-containing protein [Caldisericia bacterium]HQG59947.1 stalk domain-containing protein [Caldisericia bacterium]HQH48845.1 stalk domain-containing protein [Caldisericia bacterium]